MTILVVALDLMVFALICASAWFWYAASRNRLRRVSMREELDAADINRIIVAMNRSQILNSRAAMATAYAGMLAFLRLLVDVESLALP